MYLEWSDNIRVSKSDRKPHLSQNISGLIHLVNNEKIPKYDLLKLFSKYMNKDIEIEKYEDYFSDKSLIRTKEDFNYKVPEYEKMIEELSRWIKINNRYGYR